MRMHLKPQARNWVTESLAESQRWDVYKSNHPDCGHILDKSQIYLNYFTTIPQPYLSPASAISQKYISDVSQIYLSHISTLSQPNLSHISAISQPYLSYVSAISLPYLTDISTIFKPYLSHVSASMQLCKYSNMQVYMYVCKYVSTRISGPSGPVNSSSCGGPGHFARKTHFLK